MLSFVQGFILTCVSNKKKMETLALPKNIQIFEGPRTMSCRFSGSEDGSGLTVVIIWQRRIIKIEKTKYYIIIVDLFGDLLKALFNAYLSFMNLPAT